MRVIGMVFHCERHCGSLRPCWPPIPPTSRAPPTLRVLPVCPPVLLLFFFVSRSTAPHDAGARRGRAAGADGPCADAPGTHTFGRGPRHCSCPRPGPHRDGHQPPGAVGLRQPHAGAAQAQRPYGAALRRRRRPTTVPPMRRPGGDPGAHARGVPPLTPPLAPLSPGGTRGGLPPPTRGQSPVGGLVALRRRHMDGSLLLRTGARGRRGAAARHSPLQPARGDLCGRFPPPHAPAGGLRMGASQPPAEATPPRAPKRGGPGTPMAHCGGGRPPSPSPAP